MQMFYTNCPRCMVKVKINWNKEALDFLMGLEKEKTKEVGEKAKGLGV